MSTNKLSYLAKRRYKRGPGPKHMTAYVPTYYTLEHFGGPKKRGPQFKGVNRTKQHQMTHDVGFAEAFVRCPAWRKSEWVGEDVFTQIPGESGYGVKVVDALICTDGDATNRKTAIDFLGKYSAPRIRELAEAFASRKPPIPFAFY